MKKKCFKLISILIVLFICIGVISNISNASFKDVDVDFMTKDAKDTSGCYSASSWNWCCCYYAYSTCN